MIVGTTERAEKETLKHSKGRRKVLITSHGRLLGHKKPEARGQITNQTAKSSLTAPACAQLFTSVELI